MRSFIKESLKKLNSKSNENKILLGRWGYKNSNLKSHFANHDHCGDKICKDPLQLKKNIKNEKI